MKIYTTPHTFISDIAINPELNGVDESIVHYEVTMVNGGEKVDKLKSRF